MSTWLVALVLLVPMLQAEPVPAGKADAGKAFWRGQMCSFCHGTAGEGGWGPDLAGRALSVAQFKRALREPWGLMPAHTDTQVSDQSIADLHAFLTSLPRVEKLGAPRWRHPPPGAPEGQRLQSAYGCGQCHGPELLVPRAWLLANDRPGGVPDAEFGVSKDAGFSYFAKMVYDHSEKYPKGTMGSFSRDRLPEVLLREIYRFMLDAGLRVRMEAALAVGAQQGANTTYTLTVANVGRPKGPTVEDLTIFVRVPPGTTVVSATGTGYKGVRPRCRLPRSPRNRLGLPSSFNWRRSAATKVAETSSRLQTTCSQVQKSMQIADARVGDRWHIGCSDELPSTTTRESRCRKGSVCSR